MESKYHRSHRIITDAIEILDLKLKNVNVLTEVASGWFVFTPIIAALAGAKKVFAVVNDSSYGKAEDIVKNCLAIAVIFEIDTSIFEFSKNNIPESFLKNADIVTNSGHLRPLNAEKLKHLKTNAVIPIMYEKWELRPTDIDLEYCKEHKITLAGTWENHPDLKIFDYCKQLMLKIIFEAGFEIKGNNIIVFSSDHYGDLLKEGCEALGAQSVLLSIDYDDILRAVPKADFIFFCDYNNRKTLIGTESEALFKLAVIKQLNSGLCILHLAGAIDAETVNKFGFSLYPNKNGYPQKMTETLAHLGPKPILMLQAAGLKVGQELLNNDITSLSQTMNYDY